MNLVVRNLSDQLVDLVRNRILAGAVPADHPIRQDALAAELGVSKIPLREALARLEQEGLVRSQANRGFFVRPMSTAEAEDIFALRIKLEPEAAALAAAHATEADHAYAAETFETLARLTDAHGEGVGALNRAFHLALFQPCGRSVTVNILERLHILSERYVRKHLEPLARAERANEEHRQLLDTWLSRDGEQMAALTEAHISKTLEDLRQQLAGG